MRRALSSTAVALGLVGGCLAFGGAATAAGSEPARGGGISAVSSAAIPPRNGPDNRLGGLGAGAASAVAISGAGSPGTRVEAAVLRYPAAAPSGAAATPAPSGSAATDTAGGSSTSALTLQDITYLIGVIGLIGAALVAAGVIGILRARRRPAPNDARLDRGDPYGPDRGQGAGGYDDAGWRQQPDGINEPYPGDRGIESSGGNRRPGGSVYGAKPAGGGVYGGNSAPPSGGGVYGGGPAGGSVYGGGQAAPPGGYRGGAGGGRDDDYRPDDDYRGEAGYRGGDYRGRAQQGSEYPAEGYRGAGAQPRPPAGRPGGYGAPPAREGYPDDGGYGYR